MTGVDLTTIDDGGLTEACAAARRVVRDQYLEARARLDMEAQSLGWRTWRVESPS